MRHSWAHKIILLRVPPRYFQSPACILVLFSQLHSFFISAELSQDAVEGLFLISWIFTLTVVPFISFSVKSIRQKTKSRLFTPHPFPPPHLVYCWRLQQSGYIYFVHN